MASPMKVSSGTYADMLIAIAVVSFRTTQERGYLPSIKQQITDMAVNGSGIRDTARVLKISPTTVIEELKKTSPVAACEQKAISTT